MLIYTKKLSKLAKIGFLGVKNGMSSKTPIDAVFPGQKTQIS